jgi:NADPH-dependent curcumin reductase CurA
LTNWFEVVSNRLTITGFIVLDFAAKFPAAIGALVQAVREGKLTVEGTETIREVGFEHVPEVWKGLFEGTNRGKLVTKLV